MLTVNVNVEVAEINVKNTLLSVKDKTYRQNLKGRSNFFCTILHLRIMKNNSFASLGVQALFINIGSRTLMIKWAWESNVDR